jgi:AcrR family transcriptional regulator
MTTASRPHRRTPLTRARVLRAALGLADQIGIGALSMRNLGEALGVEAMSLYKHVANKDDLLDGLVDIVVGEIEAPRLGGDWQDAMRQRARSAHRVLMQHPWATMLIVSRVNVGPAMLRYVDSTIGCLREAGFSYPMADHAWNAIDSHVYGFTLQKLNFPLKPEDYAASAKAFLPSIPEDQYPYLHGMSRQVIDGHHDGLHDLEFGLDLILDGLERMRTRRAPDAAGRSSPTSSRSQRRRRV